MLDNFLREVVTIVVGKTSEPIAELLHSKKHVNEFILAKKLDITINQTRNILYKLSDEGLVSRNGMEAIFVELETRPGWKAYA